MKNESKGGQRSEVMPNISDVMLQKLKLHRAQTGRCRWGGLVVGRVNVEGVNLS